MVLNANKGSKHGSSGLLKTTTWGTLIALSLVVAFLGFTGHLPSFSDVKSGHQATATLASHQGPVSREASTPKRGESLFS